MGSVFWSRFRHSVPRRRLLQRPIRIEVGTADWTPKNWDFVYRLTLPDQDNRLLALAKTGMVAFDYTTRKVVHVPDPCIGPRPLRQRNARARFYVGEVMSYEVMRR